MTLTLKPTVIRVALTWMAVIPLLCGTSTISRVAQARNGKSLDTPEEQQTYRINHCFNEGNRDGYRDRRKQQRRSPNQKCSDLEARQAEDAGYQLGLRGQRSYRRDHRLSNWARPRVSQ